MKHGLVLEGGAMRGMFTAGVLDVLMEHNIYLDGVAAVSAGAAFGCNYKSKQPGRAVRYNLRFCKDPRYCSFRSLAKTGNLFGADFCYHEIPNRLDPFDQKTFADSPMDFYVVCTDVNTGKPVYRNCKTGDGEELEWIRASASMPLVSSVVKVGAHRLLDGGVADPIPLAFLESKGYQKNVVVLTQPLTYQKEKNKTLPFARMVLKDLPNTTEAMRLRHLHYNATTDYIRKRERTGDIFVLRPESSLGIGRVEHDPERIRATYHAGRAVAEKRLPALQAFLAQASQT